MLIREFLDTAFHPFDYAILKLMHEFAENGGLVFKPFIKFFDTIGNDKLLLIVVPIVLFFAMKNKRYAYTIGITYALCIVLNSLIIKECVARIRPYMSSVEDYKIWWEFAGKLKKGGFSFVSGHTLRSVACLYVVYLENKNIQYLVFTIVFSVFTIISRIFFIVHYPSDCLFAIILGLIMAYGVYYIVVKLEDKLNFIMKKIFPFAFKK